MNLFNARPSHWVINKPADVKELQKYCLLTCAYWPETCWVSACFCVWSMCQPTRMSTVSCETAEDIRTVAGKIRDAVIWTQCTCWSQPWNNTHPEVGAEDMWVAVCHLKNTFDTLTKQLWSVHVFKDGLQIAHHHLKHTAGPIYCTSLQGFASSAITLLYTSMWCESMIWMIWQPVTNWPKYDKHPW